MAESVANAKYKVQLRQHGISFQRIKEILSIDTARQEVVAKGVYCGDETISFADHFVGNPIHPGIFIPEALSQTLYQIVQVQPELAKFTFFLRDEHTRHFGPILPGAVITYTCTLTKAKIFSKGGVVEAKGKAEVDGKVVATSELLFSMIPADFPSQ